MNKDKGKIDLEWEPRDKTIRNNDVEIRLADVAIGTVSLKQVLGGVGTSQNEVLKIRIELTNRNPTKKIEYTSWAGGDYSFGRDFAILKDNFKNNYKRITFGATSLPVGAVERSTSIYPDSMVSDLLVFEVPLDRAVFLEIEMPASNLGGEGKIQFRIPTKAIRRSNE